LGDVEVELPREIGSRAGEPVRGSGLHAHIPVLLYHGVPAAGPGADRYTVTRRIFAEHLHAILDSGRTPVTVGDIAAGLQNRRSLPQRPVAITFDDGYYDTEEALEALCAWGLCASVYVTTGRLDMPGMMRRSQLERLATLGDPVELGAHSVSHPRLDELDARAIEREVTESKAQLEQIVGRRVETFAYPHGAYDRRVRAAVITAGYQSAAAVKNALSHAGDDPWAVARWTVCSDTTAATVAEVLDGRGVPSAWRHERLRTRGYRAARRLRRAIAGAGGTGWAGRGRAGDIAS
jgi:peptidoglycan/xylan/chitin deacetylase (PgdA/CDA1 family)